MCPLGTHSRIVLSYCQLRNPGIRRLTETMSCSSHLRPEAEGLKGLQPGIARSCTIGRCGNSSACEFYYKSADALSFGWLCPFQFEAYLAGVDRRNVSRCLGQSTVNYFFDSSIVVLVTSTSSSKGIGLGPPLLTAAKKTLISSRCPLSCRQSSCLP